MDFVLTEAQQALCDTARRWLASRPDSTAGAAGWEDGWWAELTSLGWLDDGLGLVEAALLAEHAAAALLGGPWFATTALALPAFRAAGRPVTGPATLAWAEPPPGAPSLSAARHGVACRAEPDGNGWRLTGHKRLVPQPYGEVVVVATGPSGTGLYLVAAIDAAPALRAMSTVDASRPVAELALAGLAARPLVAPEHTTAVLIEAWRRSLAILAAEAVGVAQHALDIAIDYAKVRTQFGRPIGSYQAVSHRLAQVAAELHLARSLAYRAAWCVQAGAHQADEAVLSASIAARRVALDACEAAVQTLGGVGFSWAHPLHPRYRRARWIAAFDATPADYRAELAHRLIDV